MVPQDAYSSLMSQQKQLYSPVVNQLSNLDQELQSVLTNPNLSSDAKYYQYMNAFGRYQNLRQTKQQQPANIQTADVKTLETDTQTGDDLPFVALPVEERRLIDSLPKPVRWKGKILLDYIKGDPQNFQWLKSVELLRPEGHPIPSSNITDLFHYAARN